MGEHFNLFCCCCLGVKFFTFGWLFAFLRLWISFAYDPNQYFYFLSVCKKREREGKTEDKIAHFIPPLWAEAGANKNVIFADFYQWFCKHEPQQTYGSSSSQSLSGKVSLTAVPLCPAYCWWHPARVYLDVGIRPPSRTRSQPSCAQPHDLEQAVQPLPDSSFHSLEQVSK